MLADPPQIHGKRPTVIRTQRSSFTSKIDGSDRNLLLIIAYFWLLLSLPIIAGWPPPITFALMLMFPMTLLQVHTQLPRGVISLALLWLTGIAIADSSNNNLGSLESLQALSRPVVIIATICAVLAIESKESGGAEWLYVSFSCVFGIGTMLHGFDLGGIDGLWKYVIGWPVTVLTLYQIHIRRGERTWFVVASLVLATISLVLGARSLALITLVGLVLTTNITSWQQANWPKRFGRLAVVALVLVSFVNVYGRVALTGGFGIEQRDKWQAQTQTQGFLGPLVGGRPESVVALTAIEARPLWGWGTRIDLPSEVQGVAFRRMAQSHISTASSDVAYYFRQSGTYLHSQLPTEWAAHGAMAAAGLLGLLLVGWRTVLKGRRRSARFGGEFAILLLTNATWNIMFSPWSAGGATILGLALAVALASSASRRSLNE